MQAIGDTQHSVFFCLGAPCLKLKKGWYAQQLLWDGEDWQLTALRGPFADKNEADHESDLIIADLPD